MFHGGVRPTRDVDFFVMYIDDGPRWGDDPQSPKSRLNALLNERLPRHFPGEPRWPEWLAAIKIDLSPCLIVTDCRLEKIPRRLEPADHPGWLKVTTLEDLVAQKIVAMADNLRYKRRRCQDLFDVAHVVGSGRPDFDRERVLELGRRGGKSERSAFPATRSRPRCARGWRRITTDCAR